MANTSRRLGFRPKNASCARVNQIQVTSAQVISEGDVVTYDSAGTLIIYAGTGSIAGVAAGKMFDKNAPIATTYVLATANADTFIDVYTDPNEVFIGELTSYALADPFTSQTVASRFDFAGTTGVQYIDAAASTNDDVIIIGPAPDPKNGKLSIVGANAKVEFKIAPDAHAQTVYS